MFFFHITCYKYSERKNMFCHPNTRNRERLDNRYHTTSDEIHLWAMARWCHQMETFSALLAICAGNSQKPVTRSFDVFFDRRLNNRLSKQSWGWWFETLSRPLWRHCNGGRDIRWRYMQYGLLYISVLNSTFVAFYCIPCKIEINHTTSMLQGLIYCEITIVENSGCETSHPCRSRRDK